MTPEYEAYMQSDAWKTIRSTHPDPHYCVACKATYNLRLHHMRYPADIWKTTTADCCWLCEGCHDAFHRACVGERLKYKAWATNPCRTAMIVNAQRREEEAEGMHSVAVLVDSMCSREKGRMTR